jgi:cell wall-associated NlpC family hydrolase
MTAVPEIAPDPTSAPTSRPGGRHRAPEDATPGSMGVVPADRRSRSAHGRHGRPAGHGDHTGSHPLGRAARTAGLSLAALGAVATAGGLATHGLVGGETPPATGETATSPQLASANLAIAPAAPAAPALDAATTSVLPVVSSGPASGVSSIKRDSPDSRAAAARTAQQDQERQSSRQASSGGEEQASSAGSSVARQAIAAARGQIGVPYVWGGTSPSGFDCSGLTQWAFEKAGVDLPRTSRAQAQAGEEVDLDNMQPGDLIFFNSPVSHVGIYIGDGKMIEAPRSGKDVKISSVAPRMDDAVGARRFA